MNIQLKSLIIYFNDFGIAISWDEVKEAQNTFELIQVYKTSLKARKKQ